MHTTLAVDDVGLPPGALRCSCTRQAGEPAPKTQPWIDGLHDIDEAVETLPRKTRVVAVMDREADLLALLALLLKRTDVLVRARVNRTIGSDTLLALLRRDPDGAVDGAAASSGEVVSDYL